MRLIIVPPNLGKTPHIRHVKFEILMNQYRSHIKYGSPGRARTADLMINSHPLYRLSYRGMRRNLKSIPLVGQ